MPRITARELKDRRREFLEEAGRAFDGMLGSVGQNGLVTFEERQDRACELGDALTRRLLEEHLEADDLADPDGEVNCPICNRPVRCESPEKVEMENRELLMQRGKVQYERAARRCKHCRRVFFPADERMKLGCEGYSPGLLRKIEFAGGNSRSFESAADSLERLAECSISGRHVERLTEKLGRERGTRRDKDAQAMKDRKLRGAYKQPPTVAVVMLDAGKAQFRDEDKGPGVHGARWGDTKVACLQTYSDVEYKEDPQPDPPEAFLDSNRVERLCREMEQVRGAGGEKQKQTGEKDKPPEKEQRKKKRKKHRRRKRPERLVRTVVATTAKVEEFGWMVSAHGAG